MHRQFYTLEELLVYVAQTTGNDQKGMCEFDEASDELAAGILRCTGLDVREFRLTLDSYGIRHALNGHSQERGSRDMHPLTTADILALPSWIVTPFAVLPGNQQPDSQ